ncbi:MAG: hypothetical protein QME74_07430 [Candidatus Edwardsbacteria bacterium]|nr:hypothetical protein [Candidatus Edwardsbacteria bacterium]
MREQRIWAYSPRLAWKNYQGKEQCRSEVQKKADELIAIFLKPQFIQPPPPHPKFNYIVDIFGKWRQHFFQFSSRYACPGPNAISPYFETGFARLEWYAKDRFNLAYHRHTGQWLTVEHNLTLSECFEIIKNGPLFQP